jgi:NAD(P)H-flavin reductase
MFIYPCVAVWLFDRLLRALRILAFNPIFWNTKATATSDASSNLVRIDVPFKYSITTPKPGTYYYIYVLNNLLYAHQNHPFTVAYTTPGNDQVAYMTPENEVTNASPTFPLLSRPHAHRTNSSGSTESDSLLSPPTTTTTPQSPSLTFLIRPYDGFTRRLALTTSRSPTHLRVLIEGPYGNTIPLTTYPNILFIVGGTGIAVVLSHLSRLLSSESALSTLRIVWAVREHAFLASVLKDFAALLGDERVAFEAHVTQDESKDDVSDEGIKRVEILTGRPDVFAVVREAVREAGQEHIAVMACGPAQMADQARRASVDMLGEGYRGVEYFEESFKW